MIQEKLIECVPNFSEGVDMSVIKEITDEIEKTPGVKLLDVDPGKATNRTVVTFVGNPDAVIDAAYLAIKKASECIDMRSHTGEHPRMGATDVCPLIPISGIAMEEVAQYAHQLGERVGQLGIPVYMYEEAATTPKRRNLAVIRSGEYEGFAKKMESKTWAPDYGPSTFNEKAGATVIGARDFLVAYNVNLNTTSVRRANSVAFDVREQGRVKRKGNPITGKIVKNKKGEALRVKGMCKAVKGIGWYIEEYGIAQVSMNLTNIKVTSLHEAFEACVKSATSRGMRVTGSELVGLVPKQVMIDAGKHFLHKQNRSTGISDMEIIHIAIKSMGLDELTPFDPTKKIIEYVMEDTTASPLIHMSLKDFADETASESPAPGGGSVAAYVGALGVSLGAMVANLSSHKRGWDKKWKHYSDAAETGQLIKDKLIQLVDADTLAFNNIIAAIRLPKGTPEEKKARQDAMDEATRNAIRIPLEVMTVAHSSYTFLTQMAHEGNPNSLSDVGVGAHCVASAVYGAYLNVKINCQGFDDTTFVTKSLKSANSLLRKSNKELSAIKKLMEVKLST